MSKKKIKTPKYFLKKKGTTWTSEIVCWLAHSNDPAVCMTKDLADRVPYLEIVNPKTGIPFYQELDSMPESKTRFIKTHLPPSLLHPSIWEVKPKVIVFIGELEMSFLSYFHYRLCMHIETH
jgi:hypothetical protein